ncbi:MAG: class I SAM-dependent RNA methyltransferase, partial [Bacillota bacterium]|nr:class I SAM-dependent RNA methyltransferase [Bacillota bacterium]
LVDPFCGSGTIPIEAALMGLNMAPGFNREFVSEQWPLIPEELWRQARQETHDMVQFDRQLEIVGADYDPRAVHAAKHNAIVAEVGEYTRFQVQPLSTCSSKGEYGKIICNPPYGERLGEREQVGKLYQEMGAVFSKLESWSYYIITSHPAFERLFGRRASKKRKLYNGDIKVDYYQYFGPRPPRTFFRPDGDEDLERRATK